MKPGKKGIASSASGFVVAYVDIYSQHSFLTSKSSIFISGIISFIKFVTSWLFKIMFAKTF